MKPSYLLLPLLPLSLALPTPAPAESTTYSDRHIAKRSTLNTFLALVASLFPVNVAISSISNLITSAESVVASVFGITTTENDIVNGHCATLTIVFSRGTTETGNVGALVGPWFFDAVSSGLSGGATLAVQGVDYAADVEGFLVGGDSTGSSKMASLVKQAFSQCPSTKVVMAGYSQGGQLVHNAAKLLGTSVMGSVSSVVIFGDPDNGQSVTGVSSSKTKVICHDGDNICQGGDLILLPHLTYAENADAAASFVLSAAGL